MEQYLAAGVRSVWVLDPRERTLTQHRPGAAPAVLSGTDDDVEEPVLPGFGCKLHELFGEGQPSPAAFPGAPEPPRR